MFVSEIWLPIKFTHLSKAGAGENVSPPMTVYYMIPANANEPIKSIMEQK
jgi:hypothetical protein